MLLVQLQNVLSCSVVTDSKHFWVSPKNWGKNTHTISNSFIYHYKSLWCTCTCNQPPNKITTHFVSLWTINNHMHRTPQCTGEELEKDTHKHTTILSTLYNVQSDPVNRAVWAALQHDSFKVTTDLCECTYLHVCVIMHMYKYMYDLSIHVWS